MSVKSTAASMLNVAQLCTACHLMSASMKVSNVHDFTYVYDPVAIYSELLKMSDVIAWGCLPQPHLSSVQQCALLL